jgi:hypothetical protein
MIYELGESTIDEDQSYSHVEQHDQSISPYDDESSLRNHDQKLDIVENYWMCIILVPMVITKSQGLVTV